jgi:hypothetical protein
MLNLHEIEMSLRRQALASCVRRSSCCANIDSNLRYVCAPRLVGKAGDKQKIRTGGQFNGSRVRRSQSIHLDADFVDRGGGIRG